MGSNEARAEGISVLIVDDEPIVLDCLEWVVRKAGYTPTMCTSPISALALLRGNLHEISLLITDASMPEMSGFDLVAEARRLRPTLPCILTSGRALAMDECEWQKVGAHRMFAKPFDLLEMVRAVKAAIDGAD